MQPSMQASAFGQALEAFGSSPRMSSPCADLVYWAGRIRLIPRSGNKRD